jgi:amino acid adenylation domain-containing protein
MPVHSPVPRPPGSAGDVEDVYPLTAMQEGILFHSRSALMAGEPDEYFRQYVGRIRGELDAEAFLGVWRDAADRHPILRTAFAWEEREKPVQVVFRRVELPCEVIDLRPAAPEERTRLVESFLAEDRRRMFDLGAAPLLRLALLRVADDLCHLVLSYHHLLLDGWSRALVFAEAAAHYRTGAPPPEPRPFRDYIEWLERRDAAADEAFWRDLLRGCSEPARIAVQPPAGGGGTGEAESVKGEVPEREMAELGRFCRAHRLTLGTLAHGAWGLLLGLYCGADEVVFGSVVSGRPIELEGVDRMVGMFVNTLPVRVALDPREACRLYLARLQRQSLEARQHEHTPLIRIQRCSELPRGIALFETILAFESFGGRPAPGKGIGRPEVRIESSETLGGTNYPITAIVNPDRRLELRLDFDPRRFDRPTVARMLEHFRRLLTILAERPDEPVGTLSPLSGQELAQVLRGWNDTWEEAGDLAHRRFARQAEISAGRDAVVCGEETLTYRELDGRSARLARLLRSHGVGPESRVAVLLDRSAGIAVALLGILRAGGAYVPLDPVHPGERLKLLLEEAAPAVLLTRRSLLRDLPPVPAAVVCLDDDAAAPDGGEPLLDLVEPGYPAYVVFTSGSTGRPKGVQISHGALANVLASMGRRIPLAGGDTLLAVTTFAFDIASLEILLPLVSGARVAIAWDEVRDPVRLARLIDEVGATLLQATPTAWQMLIDAGWSGEPRLRILCGGEALGRQLADALLARGAGVWNGYGPSETAIYSTLHQVGRGEGAVPIGGPLGNTKVLVLDPWLRCMPVGVPGDLYIGGLGVARGYLGKPDLTAASFLPDPFAETPGGRLYRTGDRALWRADGALEFLGRSDFQVKIRGHRIEPGEIEQAMLQHPRVRQAAVVAREDETGQRRLVAYLVVEDRFVNRDELFVHSADELRSFLRGRLPEAMIPAFFVTLDAMPLSPNGKLDRKALPAPSRRGAADRYVAPRNHVERAMAEAWSEALGVDRVGVHDNFFDLGGDSTVLIRILSRLHLQGIRLTPKQVFDLHTIARLAEAASVEAGAGPEGEEGSQAPSPEVELNQEELEGLLSELGGFAE